MVPGTVRASPARHDQALWTPPPTVRRWHPAGEARYLPHRSRSYRRRGRLTRNKDGKKTGSFTLPVLTDRAGATRHDKCLWW